jgi:hypothetical protein
MGRKQSSVEFAEAPGDLHRGGLVFEDAFARIFDDPAHSAEEAREIIIGHSIAGRLLLVCFIEPLEDEVRIISARRVTKREKNDYEEYIANQT